RRQKYEPGRRTAAESRGRSQARGGPEGDGRRNRRTSPHSRRRRPSDGRGVSGSGSGSRKQSAPVTTAGKPGGNPAGTGRGRASSGDPRHLFANGRETIGKL